MNINIIVIKEVKETATLSNTHAALTAALARASAADTEVNTAIGALCENPDYILKVPSGLNISNPSEYYKLLNQIKDRKHNRRMRRIFLYGARLQLLAAVNDLYEKYQEQVTAIKALRAIVPHLAGTTRATACFDAVLAEGACLEAYKARQTIMDKLRYGHDLDTIYHQGNTIDLRLALDVEFDELSRDWTVMSSGHGSAFRFEEGDGHQPPSRDNLLTRREAYLSGYYWEGIADTIGGRAQLYNVATGKEHPLEWLSDSLKDYS